MNNVSEYIEKSIKEYKMESNKSIKFDYNILRSKNITTTKNNIKKIYDLYLDYKREKKNFNSILDKDGSQKYKTIEQYNKNIKQRAYQIVSSSQELANIAVDICYVIHPNDTKSFVWNVFGEEILDNIKANSETNICFIPFEDNLGNIDFLGEKYSMMEVSYDKNI